MKKNDNILGPTLLGVILAVLPACSSPWPDTAPSLVWTDGDRTVNYPRWYVSQSQDMRVVGYLPSYRIRSLDTDQLTHLTDLIYFAVSPRSDGSFGLPTAPELTWLKTQSSAYNLKIHLGIAEHTRARQASSFATIAASAPLRRSFATRLSDFLAEQGFQGADLDWEYPRTEAEKANFALLLEEIRSKFQPLGLELTIAVSPWHEMTPAAYAAADFIHLMTYDDTGRHATLAGTQRHLERFTEATGAGAKTLLGLPFYARGYTSRGPRWNQSLMYKTLRERFNPEESVDSVGGYYFNGPATIAEKVRLAREKGLAGVMIWEIGQDTNDQHSLLRAITRVRDEAEAVLVQAPGLTSGQARLN